jgi:hypothetical protein
MLLDTDILFVFDGARKAMKMLDVYCLFTTPDIVAQREFYRTHFAAKVVFESSWVVASAV